jgi:hypothetical protein
MAFGRVVQLLVGKFDKGNESGGETVLDLSGLDIEFDVTRSVEWYDNGAEITLYNPSPDTLNTIMNEGNSVILKAGYEDQGGAKTIFAGQIAYVSPRRDGRDIVLEINCVQARGNFYQLARLHMAVSFPKNKKIRECLQEMCDYAQIVLRAGAGAVLDEGIDFPFRSCGTFNAVVREFYDYEEHQFGKTIIYLDNNELIVMDRDKALDIEDVYLDHESGLLECRVERDEGLNKVNFDDLEQMVPVTLMLIAMPISGSIGHAIGIGLIAYTVIKVLNGKPKEVSVLTYVISLIFLVKFFVVV